MPNKVTEICLLTRCSLLSLTTFEFYMLNMLTVENQEKKQHEINIKMAFSGACSGVCEQAESSICAEDANFQPDS